MARKSKLAVAENAAPLPHSWSLAQWPSSVFPHSTERGRNLFREHRDELIACHAITRVGKRIVFLGAGFAVFLGRGMGRVADYEIAPNAARSANAHAASAAHASTPAQTSPSSAGGAGDVQAG